MQIYVFNAALLCEECGTEEIQNLTQQRSDLSERLRNKQDSDEWPQGPFGDGGGEADCPQHCDSCGLFLENLLTEDGQDYVREQYALARDENLQSYLNVWRDHSVAISIGVTQAWANYYDYLELPGEGNCCICTREILPRPGSTWRGGNNAEPVAPGRCCNVCDSMVVLPERMLSPFRNATRVVCNNGISSPPK